MEAGGLRSGLYSRRGPRYGSPPRRDRGLNGTGAYASSYESGMHPDIRPFSRQYDRAYEPAGLERRRERSPYIPKARPGRSRERSPYIARARASPPYISKSDVRPFPSAITRERSPYISRFPLGLGFRRSPSPFLPLPRKRSPLGLAYGRSLSPFLPRPRSRSPVGLSYRSRSPYSRNRSLPWIGPDRPRSPLGLEYGRSLSPLYYGLPGPRLPRGRPTLYRSPPRRFRHRSRSPQRDRAVRPATKERFRPARLSPSRENQLKVKNFPTHCSDESLRHGLQHTFKKYGPISLVLIHGSGEERYAVVGYRSSKERDDALDATKGTSFFGMEVEVTAWKSNDMHSDDKIAFRHGSSMTLYVGSLDKTTTSEELKNIFQPYGEILYSEVKRAPGPYNYGFLQFFDILSVSKAIREMDGKTIGKNKVRLGFGKNLPTSCIWIYGLLNTDITEKILTRRFRYYGTVEKVLQDTSKGTALIFYKGRYGAETAIEKMRRGNVEGHIVKALFANRRLQLAFCRSLEAAGQDLGDFYKRLKESSDGTGELNDDESQMVALASDEEAMVAEASDEEEPVYAEERDEENESQEEEGADPELTEELCDDEPNPTKDADIDNVPEGGVEPEKPKTDDEP